LLKTGGNFRKLGETAVGSAVKLQINCKKNSKQFLTKILKMQNNPHQFKIGQLYSSNSKQ